MRIMSDPLGDTDDKKVKKAEIFRRNLSLLMNRHSMDLAEVAERAQILRKTLIRWIGAGTHRPQSEHLARLAQVFGLPEPRLFFDEDLLNRVESWPGRHQVDRQTNPVIDELAQEQPHLFARFGQAEWNALYSMHGTGGPLTREGVICGAERLLAKKDLRRKFEAIMETEHFAALSAIIDLMYRDTDADHAVIPQVPSPNADGPDISGLR
jgi:transcriptional regulator with XRE-family HTH domain